MNLAVNGMAGAVSALPDSISARALAGCWGIARCPFWGRNARGFLLVLSAVRS